MWTFKPGMLGVVIILLSFIGSCLFGAVINLTQEDVVKEKDQYVSDITGLYSTTAQDKAYIPYTPAKNINGYTSDNASTYAVSFTKSQTGNNYPMKYNAGAPITLSKTFPTDGAQGSGDISYYYYHTQKTVSTGVVPGDIDYGRITTTSGLIIDWAEGTSYPDSHYFAKSFSSMYSELKTEAIAYGGIDPIEKISFSVSGEVENYNFRLNPLNPTVQNIEVDILYFPKTSFAVPNDLTNTRDYCDSTYTYNTLEQCGLGETLTLTYTFKETSTGTYFDCIASGGNIQNPIYLILNGNILDYNIIYSTDVEIVDIWEYSSPSPFGGVNTIRGDDYFQYGEVDYSVTYEYQEHIQSIDPRYGISVRHGEDVVWANDYQNGSMDILAYLGSISRNEGGTAEIGGLEVQKEIEWQFHYNNPDIPDSSLMMTHDANGTTRMWIVNQLNDTTQSPAVLTPVNTETIDLGDNWIAYNIHLDFITGNVYVQPIATSGWSNFNAWASDQPTILIGQLKNGLKENRVIDGVPQTVEEWTVSSDGVTSITVVSPLSDLTNSIGMQISNTNVYMNTHGVIMVDPEVDILKWYPLNNHFKMKYTDIATFGYAITINNVTYPLTEDSIWIGEEKIDLTSFEIEFERIADDDEDSTNDLFNITITSLSDGSSAEISNASDTNVEMSGAWYFTSKYYTVDWTTEKEYKWILDGGIVYGYTGVILFTMIFMGIIAVIWWKAVPGSLTFFDIALLIGIEIILYVILG